MEYSSDQLEIKLGNIYKLVVGVSHRVRELNEGQNPLIETRDKDSVNIASEELMRGKIKIIEDPAEQE